MLRYFFFLLPLFTALFVWFCGYFELNTDFIVPAMLFAFVTFGFFSFKRFSRIQRLIFACILLAALNEIFAYYLALKYNNNHRAFHFFILIQLILYAMIYTSLIQPTKKYQYLIWSIVALIFTAHLLNSFVFSSLLVFPSVNFVLLSALLLPLSLFQFRKMILFPIATKLENQPAFWFNYGTFVFFSFGFFFLGFLSSTKNLPDVMYDIFWGTSIFLYLTYFFAICLIDPTNKVSP